MIEIKRQFILIWILSILGSLSVLPYVVYALGAPLGIIFSEGISFTYLLIKTLINASILYGIICWLSYVILKKTDLMPFKTKSVKEIIYPGILPGLGVGLALFTLNKLLFQQSALGAAAHPPLWTGLLASLYGAINEEVMCRLFLLTLIYLVLSKIFKNARHRESLMWAAILSVALLFGVGHLPAAFKFNATSGLDIFRVLSLNGIAGVVFGWLYYRHGFWTAVAAHFIADLVLHVFLIF
jgi:hypothetical protein